MFDSSYKLSRITVDNMQSYTEFLDLVSDKRLCVEFLILHYILPSSWECPSGTVHSLNLNTFSFRCRCHHGDITHSVFADTFFFRSKLRLESILSVAYEWLAETKVTVCQSRLDCSRATVIKLYNVFRSVASADLRLNPIQLGGKNVRVSVDEMLYRFDANTGRPVWIIGAVELTDQLRLFVSLIRNRTTAEITRSLRRVIARAVSSSLNSCRAIQLLPVGWESSTGELTDRWGSDQRTVVHTPIILKALGEHFDDSLQLDRICL